VLARAAHRDVSLCHGNDVAASSPRRQPLYAHFHDEDFGADAGNQPSKLIFQ
jgi:hypothetical protein